MLNCWKADPDDRPTFTQICQKLMQMLEITNQTYNYVDAVQNAEVELELSDSEEEVTV
jgi:hypothetical protein